MFDHWPWYVLILAILNWIAVEKKWKKLEYIAKPGTMILLLGWLFINARQDVSILWFMLGVLFSMAGDVFLMLPGDLFIPGLVSFLLAHVFYIIGLNSGPPLINGQGFIFLVGIAAYLFWLYRQLAYALKRVGKPALRIPVLVYSLVISLMVYSALLSGWRAGWMGSPAVFASIGAVLFYASDSMLAWDKFVHPLSHARLRVMITYHLGQLGIIIGAVWWANTVS
jgi:uncharacterized membrane protein YhhN